MDFAAGSGLVHGNQGRPAAYTPKGCQYVSFKSKFCSQSPGNNIRLRTGGLHAARVELLEQILECIYLQGLLHNPAVESGGSLPRTVACKRLVRDGLESRNPRGRARRRSSWPAATGPLSWPSRVTWISTTCTFSCLGPPPMNRAPCAVAASAARGRGTSSTGQPAGEARSGEPQLGARGTPAR